MQLDMAHENQRFVVVRDSRRGSKQSETNPQGSHKPSQGKPHLMPSCVAPDLLVEKRRFTKMKNPRNIFTKISATLAIVLAIGTAAIAKKSSVGAFSNIKISN